MVIGKGLLGAGARIPCIRTRLQVTFSLVPSIRSLAEPMKALFIGAVGGKMLSPALQPLLPAISQSCSGA